MADYAIQVKDVSKMYKLYDILILYAGMVLITNQPKCITIE